MAQTALIVWFRQDLRITDNPALHEAARRGGPVVPVYIWSPEEEGDWPPGEASRWWLHRSLQSLAQDLQGLGSPLIIRRGPSLRTLQSLANETGARSIFWNRRYEPAVAERDAGIQKALAGQNMEVSTFNGSLLQEPWEQHNKSGKPYQVFTPFWKACLKDGFETNPRPAPRRLIPLETKPRSEPLHSLELEPAVDWAGGLRASWQPGRLGAESNLKRFLAEGLAHYDQGGNQPDWRGTSRLSPHLHYGEISPRQIWQAVAREASRKGIPEAAWRTSQFVTELGWREFAYHLLHHFPHTPKQPLRTEFKRFPWRTNALWLKRWQEGRTGYPMVDAGLRELWATGWMHNRVRMIVASFLVKDLLLSWRQGAHWFWNTLVDADLASNTLGWQWAAGCGADAAPYFRIFNPITQGEKFDPTGQYVRQWIPELSRLPAPDIHRPWTVTSARLAQAGIRLGQHYPSPLVTHSIARETALDAYQSMKTSAK